MKKEIKDINGKTLIIHNVPFWVSMAKNQITNKTGIESLDTQLEKYWKHILNQLEPHLDVDDYDYLYNINYKDFPPDGYFTNDDSYCEERDNFFYHHRF